jgi:hypothetical protein
MTTANTATLRVLITPCEDYYTAQCLEYDFGVSAKTLEQLELRFEDAFFLEQAAESFHELGVAPEDVLIAWETATVYHSKSADGRYRLAA